VFRPVSVADLAPPGLTGCRRGARDERDLAHDLQVLAHQAGNTLPRGQRAAERSAKLTGAACKGVEARKTRMAAPVSFTRWFGTAPLRHRFLKGKSGCLAFELYHHLFRPIFPR
jgi:hypothetical protein